MPDDGGDRPKQVSETQTYSNNSLEQAMEGQESEEDPDYANQSQHFEPEEYEEDEQDDEVEHTNTLDLSCLSGMYLYNYGKGFVFSVTSHHLYG